MKIYGSILALCVFQPNVWDVTAFSVSPKVLTLKGAQPSVSRRFSSYLDDVNAAGQAGDDAKVSEMPMPPPDLSGQSPAAPLASSRRPAPGGMMSVRDIWEASAPVIVQGGGSLRTWSFESVAVERVQVLLRSEGRPLTADVELWQGPDNSPQKMNVYIEDGSIRPFSAVIETPRGSNTVAIRNVGQMEFPFAACVEADNGSAALGAKSLTDNSVRTIQGGAVHTYPFDYETESVQILMMTDGRPLNARIELLQGPNNNKQVIELYTEDGLERPFFAVIESPGTGNVVRIVNTSPLEFPLVASVEPYSVLEPGSEMW